MQEKEIVSKAVERMLGFEKYQKIMEKVRSVDVASDNEFQTLFNGYYEVRRNENWRQGYYRYFQAHKNDENISYENIIQYIFDNLRTNQGKPNPVEASFSSKMLATINPKMPILDSQVLNNMGLSIEGGRAQERLNNAKHVYRKICERYEKYIESQDCKKAIEIFDSYFPNCLDVTPERKIDWFLWALSKEELNGIGLFGALLNG